jgi:hypothetical protein
LGKTPRKILKEQSEEQSDSSCLLLIRHENRKINLRMIVNKKVNQNTFLENSHPTFLGKKKACCKETEYSLANIFLIKGS